MAGSTSAKLTKLVDKWFLGADHPVAAGYTYRSCAGSLFVGGPAYTDVDQGYLGDCYFIAAMGTIAKSSSSAIQNMIVDNGDNTWTVRYYYNGRADYVTVDRMLPTDSSGRLVFDNLGASYANTANELWLPLVEKAYAQWNETGLEGRDGKNDYASIEGGWMSFVDAQVLGRSAASYGFTTATKQTMISALAANRAITTGTNGSPGNGLYGGHAYLVIGYNSTNDTFTLYNPWGVSHPGALSWSQLQTSCQLFTVADASATTGISALPIARLAVGQSNREVAEPSRSADLRSQQTAADLIFGSPESESAKRREVREDGGRRESRWLGNDSAA